MAKSLRSKMQKRLRTLRRDLAKPFYDKKEAAKLAAQQAALDAPKVPVRAAGKDGGHDNMATEAAVSAATPPVSMSDVEMADEGSSKSTSFLKPLGGVGKKWKKKQKGKRRGKGKNKRKHK